MVSLDGSDSGTPWVTLTQANSHYHAAEAVFRRGQKFQDRSFRKIASIDEMIRHEWRRESAQNPGTSLGEIIERVSAKMTPMWPNDPELRNQYETTRRLTLAARPTPCQQAATKGPPTKTPRNKRVSSCKMFMAGRCKWGANCRRPRETGPTSATPSQTK